MSTEENPAPQVDVLAAAAEAAAAVVTTEVIDDAAAGAAATAAAASNDGAAMETTTTTTTTLETTTTVDDAGNALTKLSDPGRLSLLNDEDAQGKRKFFPRVKHLIGNTEWEDFLTTVLQTVDRAGAPETASASHKSDNAWVIAFDAIYDGVASEYSVPTGKNRYHKFKDKIVEVWTALENMEPGQHNCRDRALGQLERHRQALAEHATHRQLEKQQQQLLQAANGGVEDYDMGDGPPVKKLKAGPGRPRGSTNSSTAMKNNSAALAKLAASGSKRSFGVAMGGHGGKGGSLNVGATLSYGTSGPGGLIWQNLDEPTCLASLPEPLRSLVHFKQLSREMAARTINRATKKSIDLHGKTVDTAYLTALQNYIVSIDDDDQAGAMNVTGDDDEEDERHEKEAKKLFNRAETMAFLYRYASSLEEQRVLNDEYRKHTAKYIIHITSKKIKSIEQPPPPLPKTAMETATEATQAVGGGTTEAVVAVAVADGDENNEDDGIDEDVVDEDDVGGGGNDDGGGETATATDDVVAVETTTVDEPKEQANPYSMTV